MSHDRLLEFLAGTPLLQGLEPELIEALASRLHPVELSPGETLIQAGEPGESVYFVVEGRLQARQQTRSGAPRVLGSAARGDIVGEMAVLSGQPRLCSVVAVCESKVLRLSRTDFLDLLARHPDCLLRATHQIIRRLHHADPTSSPWTKVALIPLGKSVQIADFAQSLVSSLSGHGRIGLLRERDIAFDLQGDALAGHLHSVEQEHDMVVYEADADMSRWTRRCIQQADLILLVCDADSDPALSAVERAWIFCDQPLSAAPAHLVLLHRAHRRPARTQRWLEWRHVKLHHHVAVTSAGDLGRLARLITGESVNLVMSSGGARGFAHIGVVRALREAQIPIDFVGGSSMGAAAAAQCAMEFTSQEMHEVARSLCGAVKDVTFPWLSVFSGRKATEAFQRMCGDWNIEDLWINFFAVSTDLRHAEEVVHRSGPLWLALRASSSIPGAYPPVLWQQRCLADGCVLNGLPIDVMERLTDGRIVAVDASQEVLLDFPAEHPVESGWRLLGHRLNPFRRAPRSPHIGDVISRASEVAAVRISRTIRATTPTALTIIPPVDHFKTLDFMAIDAIVETAYRFACEHVEAWKRALVGPRTAA